MFGFGLDCLIALSYQAFLQGLKKIISGFKINYWERDFTSAEKVGSVERPVVRTTGSSSHRKPLWLTQLSSPLNNSLKHQSTVRNKLITRLKSNPFFLEVSWS